MAMLLERPTAWEQSRARTTATRTMAPMRMPTAGGGAACRMRLSTDTSERRRGLRVRQARPVKLLDMAKGRTVAGQTLDVSTTGLRVELPAGSGLRVGEVLGIHVGLSRIGERLANRREMVPVRIVWIDHDGGREGFLMAGVEFSASIGAQRDAA